MNNNRRVHNRKHNYLKIQTGENHWDVNKLE